MSLSRCGFFSPVSTGDVGRPFSLSYCDFGLEEGVILFSFLMEFIFQGENFSVITYLSSPVIRGKDPFFR